MVVATNIYSDKAKEQAKKVNLVEYCRVNNIDLLDERSLTPKLSEHDSLVFFPDNTESQWYRFSTGEGGDAISFIQFYHDVSFKEAIEILLDDDIQEHKIIPKKEIEKFAYDNREVKSFEKAQDYLVNERKIDSNLVTLLNDKGFIKENNYGNVVFKWVDYENGQIVGANEQGTRRKKDNERSWKKIQKNSTRGHGFNIKIGNPNQLNFFESSIDMLSYISLEKQKGNSLKDTWFVSMEGLKENCVHFYADKSMNLLGHQPESIKLCVDNDKAGIDFANKWKLIGLKQPDGSLNPIQKDCPKDKKDWNEQLQFECETYENTRSDYNSKTKYALHLEHILKKHDIEIDIMDKGSLKNAYDSFQDLETYYVYELDQLDTFKEFENEQEKLIYQYLKDGNQLFLSSDNEVLVTPSAKQKGYQITYFDEKGSISDSQKETLEETVSYINKAGILPLPIEQADHLTLEGVQKMELDEQKIKKEIER